MKFVALFLAVASICSTAQAPVSDHLTEAEVAAASAPGKMNTGFVELVDMSFGTAGNCKTQTPSMDIWTPEAWLHTLSGNARRSYSAFTPEPKDTLRDLTVVTHGCVDGTPAGPVCESITRVVILSDTAGSKIVEAEQSFPMNQSWQNGFGASAACSANVSKFPVAEVMKARNAKGEFLVAVFSGSTLLKTYTVKQKYIKQLGW